jgi:hypothetical protein
MMQIEYIAPFGCKDEFWKGLLNGILKVTAGAPPVAVRRKIRFTSSTKILEAPAPSAELELEYTDFGKKGQDGNGKRAWRELIAQRAVADTHRVPMQISPKELPLDPASSIYILTRGRKKAQTESIICLISSWRASGNGEPNTACNDPDERWQWTPPLRGSRG